MKNQLLSVIAMGCLAALLGGCALPLRAGSGRIVSEEREAAGFRRVVLTGIGDVTVEQGESEGLRVEADDNILGEIETLVRGDTLYLGFRRTGMPVPVPTRPIRFFVRAKAVEELSITGTGNIYAAKLQAENLRLEVTGAGDIRLDMLEARTVRSRISGTGTLYLSGAVNSQDVEITGAGSVRAADLESASATVQITGAGDAKVRASESLRVEIDGAGSVTYFGDPSVRQSISGLGTLQRGGD